MNISRGQVEQRNEARNGTAVTQRFAAKRPFLLPGFLLIDSRSGQIVCNIELGLIRAPGTAFKRDIEHPQSIRRHA